MKYGLLSYHTENIGDEIQSIAARRFLPSVDLYIDRDEIGVFALESTTKLIMNGWYMHEPYSWPPKDDKLNPLLISMYFEGKDRKVTNAIFQDSSLEFFKKHGPVGARDLSTLQLLQSKGVESYFSGCLTLTLQADPEVKKQDYILAVDIPSDVVEMIRQKTHRPVIESSPYYDASFSLEDRFYAAEYFLYLYQSAHAVITTRLHAMLPSLALGTNVLLVKDSQKYDPNRYAGLDNLVNSLYDEEYLNNYNLYDVDNPPSNPSEYLELRSELINKVSGFTGYNNDTTFRTIDFNETMQSESAARVFTSGFATLNKSALLSGDKAWLEEQKFDLLRQVNLLRDENRRLHSLCIQTDDKLKAIESSRSYQYSKKLSDMCHKVFRKG